MRKFYFLPIMAFFAMQVGNSPGQEIQSDTDIYELSLEELMNVNVVSASKISQKQSEAPNIINAISYEKINRFGWSGLSEILVNQPGFVLSQDYERRTMGFRGMHEGWNNNHILMLVDGVPFNDNLYGTAYTWENTPLVFSKSVEIIRGPGGALYGSNAMNGVASINTLNAGDISGNGMFRIKGGSLSTITTDVVAATENENIGIVAAFNRFSTEGNEYESLDGSGSGLKAKTRDSRNSNYFFTKVYGKGKMEGLQFQYHEQHWDFETGHGWLFNIPQKPENMNEYRRIFSLRYAPEQGDKSFGYEVTSRYQVHGINWDMHFYNPDPGGYYPNGVQEYLKTKGEDLFIRLQGNYRWNNHIFLAGTEGDYFWYNGDDAHNSNIDMNTWADPDTITYFELNPWFEFIKNKPVKNIAGYLQYISPKFINIFQLTLSGRYDNMFFDYTDLYGNGQPAKNKSFSLFTPRAALIASVSEKLTIKAIYSKAFRTPAPTELFGVNTYTLASNIDQLKPEVVNSADLAVDYSISKNVNLKINAFWINFENQIAYSTANANLSTNIYTLQSAGIETELLFSTNVINGFVNFTWVKRLDETIKDTTIAISNDEVTWVPPFYANFGIVYPTKKVDIALMGHYRDKTNRRTSDADPGRPSEVDAWFNLDTRVSYKMNQKTELAVTGKNLLNTNQYLAKSSAMPFDYRLEKRAVFLELLIRL